MGCMWKKKKSSQVKSRNNDIVNKRMNAEFEGIQASALFASVI